MNSSTNLFGQPASRTGGVTVGSSNSTSGPRSKCDQVIYEALCKACEVIVGSRLPSSNSSSPLRSAVSTQNHHTTIDQNNYNPSSNNAYSNSFDRSANSATTSTRFNLQIPEVPGVRQILSQYRAHLHVPIRLDVYYQHLDNSSSRELVERWCLEYRPSSNSFDKFLEAEGLLTTQKQDTMARLRHVCKRIVIWLRTLYIFSRFLPSQGFRVESQPNGSGVLRIAGTNDTSNVNKSSNIGFSLYVNQDGMDDFNFLIQKQGFLQQQTPSGSVATPYGQLSVCVIYLPANRLQHLLPKLRPSGTGVPYGHYVHSNQIRYKSESRSIPMNNQVEQNNSNQQCNIEHHSYSRRLSDPVESTNIQNYRRAASYSERSHQALHYQNQQQQYHVQTTHFGTLDPSSLIPPRKVDTNIQTGNRLLLNRTHNSSGPGSPKGQFNLEKPPERVMSGLSLALMMADVNVSQSPQTEEAATSSPDNPKDNLNLGIKGIKVIKVEEDDGIDINQEKRRAALHEMPPHLIDQQHTAHAAKHYQHPSSSGEYGYAYNNQIPWQKIHPCSTVISTANSANSANQHNTSLRSNSFESRPASPSPFSLQQQFYPSTPPTAAFLVGGHLSTTPIGRPRGSSQTNVTSPQPSTLLVQPGYARSRSGSIGSSARGEVFFSPSVGITVAPPFKNRPIGFIHDASIADTTPTDSNSNQQRQDDRNRLNQQEEWGKDQQTQLTLQQNCASQPQEQQQLSSLDLLHSSPFQLPHHQASFLRSATSPFVNSSGAMAMTSVLDSVMVNYTNPIWANSGFSSGYYSPRSSAAVHASENDHFYEDTMPFVVDMSLPSTGTTTQQQPSSVRRVGSKSYPYTSESTDSSLLGQSTGLTSLAQKCSAPHNRLKLFESISNDHNVQTPSTDVNHHHDHLMDSLADQLEEFRSFGASILLETPEPQSSNS